MEDGAGHDREDSFSFAPQQAYAVQIRLTPELKAELLAAQQAGRAVSLRIRHDGHGGVSAAPMCMHGAPPRPRNACVRTWEDEAL